MKGASMKVKFGTMGSGGGWRLGASAWPLLKPPRKPASPRILAMACWWVACRLTLGLVTVAPGGAPRRAALTKTGWRGSSGGIPMPIPIDMPTAAPS
ncbi:hypothetical protein [Azospirillum brasilense]|uniref:hypothetical protein n=1 Tax=Azospirillum brasilense TaxID=192 RepID=UPI000556E9A9|nr:hypothetical protein [Azospirillum brasilense]